MIAVGLMSGTSLDGIDAARVAVTPAATGYRASLQAFETIPFERDVLDALQSLVPPARGDVATLAYAHHALGSAYARAAMAVSGALPIDFVASHGQTVWHDGDRNVTLQIGDPFAIREAVRATVCFDFRSADCAAGGHGAPLVPHVDRLLFSDPGEDRVALNIGGIANLTALSRETSAPVFAYDIGPGNMLIDAFVRERTAGTLQYDRDGGLAASGTVDDSSLTAMLADGYFARPAPKTTGRERFGKQFLEAHAVQLDALDLHDGAATLTELTAATVATAIESCAFASPRVIVSGGGAHNRTLLQRIEARLSGARVETSEAMNVSIDAKEAIAFAILGFETLRGRGGNVPSVTGARHAAVLGAIAPYELDALLARVADECASCS